MVCQIMHWTGLWQEEWMRCFFLVVDTRPNDPETSFGLEFDNANIQLLVKDDCCRRVDVIGSHDFGYTLIQ